MQAYKPTICPPAQGDMLPEKRFSCFRPVHNESPPGSVKPGEAAGKRLSKQAIPERPGAGKHAEKAWLSKRHRQRLGASPAPPDKALSPVFQGWIPFPRHTKKYVACRSFQRSPPVAADNGPGIVNPLKTKNVKIKRHDTTSFARAGAGQARSGAVAALMPRPPRRFRSAAERAAAPWVQCGTTTPPPIFKAMG